MRDPRLPEPGTLLSGSYQGKSYVVKVEVDSFTLDGQKLTTLTSVAKAITGLNAGINGFLFFKLGKSHREPQRQVIAPVVVPAPSNNSTVFHPKDRVMFRGIFGIISSQTHKKDSYDVLTPDGLLQGDASDLQLVTESRSTKTIMTDIAICYNRLSPTILTCDRNTTQVQRRRTLVNVNRMLTYLFGELGRHVTEQEAHDYWTPPTAHNTAFAPGDSPC